VNGLPPSGLQDTYGRYIDGDHNGTAGGSAIAILSKGGVKLAAGPLAVASSGARAMPAAIDALLTRGRLAGTRRVLHPRRGPDGLKPHARDGVVLPVARSTEGCLSVRGAQG
jgi:hypothetical protein